MQPLSAAAAEPQVNLPLQRLLRFSLHNAARDCWLQGMLLNAHECQCKTHMQLCPACCSLLLLLLLL
jgi:hypothetical protein